MSQDFLKREGKQVPSHDSCLDCCLATTETGFVLWAEPISMIDLVNHTFDTVWADIRPVLRVLLIQPPASSSK